MSGDPIAWLHEPTGNVFKEGECQALIAVWQKQFAETIPAEEIAADFIPLVRADASSQAEIERLKKALEFYRDGFQFHANPRRAGLEWKPTETLLDDCGNVAREALLSGSKE